MRILAACAEVNGWWHSLNRCCDHSLTIDRRVGSSPLDKRAKSQTALSELAGENGRGESAGLPPDSNSNQAPEPGQLARLTNSVAMKKLFPLAAILMALVLSRAEAKDPVSEVLTANYGEVIFLRQESNGSLNILESSITCQRYSWLT